MRRLVPPPVTPSGSYEPVQMFEFLAACKKAGMPTEKVASTLDIEPHRAAYALGDGFELFRKRALEAQGVYR